MLCPDSEVPTLDIDALTFVLPDFRAIMELETCLKLKISDGRPLETISDAVALFDKINLFWDCEALPHERDWVGRYGAPLIEEQLEPIKDKIQNILIECLRSIESGDLLSENIQLTKRFVEMCFKHKLFDRLVEPILATLSESYVDKFVRKCDATDNTVLQRAEDWVNNRFKAFLFAIMPTTPQARCQAIQISSGVLLSIKRDYVHHRCMFVFELIRDFPSTEASVKELVRAIRSSCLTLPNDFVEKVLDSLRARLFISSIATEDVLQFFISSMKVLGMIDSSGCVRDTVCNEIKKFLKDRTDTVKAIISSMNAGDGIDVWKTSNPEQDILGDWEDWYPEPLEAFRLPLHCSTNTDTLTLLVGIYDSPSSFISEYQHVLCSRIFSRLLDAQQFASDEKPQLDVLTERFGKDDTCNCRMMLSDVMRSSAFSSKEFRWPFAINQDQVKLQVLLMSYVYWPALNLQANLVMPPCLTKLFQSASDRFETYLPSQKIDFYHNFEIVEIELVLETGKTFAANVTMIELLVLMRFQERPYHSLNALSEQIRVSPSLIRPALAFWTTTGIISEGAPGHYLLTEEDFVDKPEIYRTVFEGTIESKMEADPDEQLKSIRQTQFANLCWHYVLAVLRRGEGVGIERLYSIMRTHAMQFFNDIHIHEIRNLIDKKLASGELICVDNLYRLGNSSSS